MAAAYVTEKPNYYKAGQIFRLEEDHTDYEYQFYILAQTGRGFVCLVNLNDGNRWCEPSEVVNTYQIDAAEFEKITGLNYVASFKLVVKGDIINLREND